jgi:hypothetical protein
VKSKAAVDGEKNSTFTEEFGPTRSIKNLRSGQVEIPFYPRLP